jgi:hypothetical protein
MRVVSARNERRRYGVAACALREDHALRNDFSLALCDPNVRFWSKADIEPLVRRPATFLLQYLNDACERDK